MRGDGKQKVTHEVNHLWGPLNQPRPQGHKQESQPEAPQNTSGKHRAGLFRPGRELTIHGFLLKEGRHGQEPRPGGPARPGPVRKWERTETKGLALGGFGIVKPKNQKRRQGLQVGPAELDVPEAYGSRVS